MMRKLLATLPVIGLLVFGLMLQAQAHNFGGSGDCDGWTLDLDGEWGALEIFVDGVSVGLDQTPFIADTSDDEVRSFAVRWDKAPAGVSQSDVTVIRELYRAVGDCDEDETTTTTTTLPEETTTTTLPEETTTTTLPEETTTTTVADTTTTTAPEVTTTAPGLVETEFGALVVCNPDGTFTLTGDFRAGIAELLVSLSDPFFPINPDNFDGVTLTRENPSTGGNLLTFGQFSVLAVAEDGYTIVGENPILVDVEVCPTPSVVVATSVAISTSETLPFTGPEDNAALWFIASALAGLGLILVLSARRETE